MKNLIFITAALVLVSVGCKPTEYEVKREVLINAPADLIFEQINVIKNQEAFSPWERMDPNMTRTYEGPESGVGAKYSWSGNDSVGTGSMELVESNHPTDIKFKLTFTSPWEAVSDIFWMLNPTDEGVLVSWGNKGEFPGYLFWMSQKSMDEMMGPDFERGLKRLKEVVEAKAAATPNFDIQQSTVTAMPIFGITDEISWAEMGSEFFGSRYGEINAYLKADSAKLAAPPMAIYHVWDEENKRAKVEVALACNSTKPGNKRIVKRNSYEGSVVKASYYGPYEGTEAGHYAIEDYMNANALQISGSPWEVYVTDPGKEPDTSKWLTEIFYPVMTLESAEK
jgi:effector-binding domain-containing protein